MKAAILVLLVGQSLAQSSWFSSLKNKARTAVSDSSDVVQVAELMHNNHVVVESCGNSEHAMQVESVHFDSATLKVTAHGTLTREIQGGNVLAAIRLGDAAAGTSVKDKFLRSLAFSVAGQHSTSEPLCSHFARTGQMTCPVARGTK